MEYVAEKGTLIPLERVKVPCTGSPTVVGAGPPVHVAPGDSPAGIGTVKVGPRVAGAPDSEQATAEDGAFPVFCSSTRHSEFPVPPWLHVSTMTVTFCVADNVPNSPKENPAIATPATNVIAIRMTVARTGEMAILLDR